MLKKNYIIINSVGAHGESIIYNSITLLPNIWGVDFKTLTRRALDFPLFFYTTEKPAVDCVLYASDKTFLLDSQKNPHTLSEQYIAIYLVDMDESPNLVPLEEAEKEIEKINGYGFSKIYTIGVVRSYDPKMNQDTLFSYYALFGKEPLGLTLFLSHSSWYSVKEIVSDLSFSMLDFQEQKSPILQVFIERDHLCDLSSLPDLDRIIPTNVVPSLNYYNDRVQRTITLFGRHNTRLDVLAYIARGHRDVLENLKQFIPVANIPFCRSIKNNYLINHFMLDLDIWFQNISYHECISKYFNPFDPLIFAYDVAKYFPPDEETTKIMYAINQKFSEAPKFLLGDVDTLHNENINSIRAADDFAKKNNYRHFLVSTEKNSVFILDEEKQLVKTEFSIYQLVGAMLFREPKCELSSNPSITIKNVNSLTRTEVCNVMKEQMNEKRIINTTFRWIKEEEQNSFIFLDAKTMKAVFDLAITFSSSSDPILPLAKPHIENIVVAPLPAAIVKSPATFIEKKELLLANEKDETEFHLAASRNDTKTLLNLFAKLSKQSIQEELARENKELNTPLDCAVRNAQDEACALLLQYNARSGRNPAPLDLDYRKARLCQIKKQPKW